MHNSKNAILSFSYCMYNLHMQCQRCMDFCSVNVLVQCSLCIPAVTETGKGSHILGVEELFEP